MPEAWSEPMWECFFLFSHAPGAKSFPAFCPGGLRTDGKVDDSRADAQERESVRKRKKRDAEREAEEGEKRPTHNKENTDPSGELLLPCLCTTKCGRFRLL